MNLQQLSYFVAVARSRNFSRAAESCFVAQPALSQQVRKLEEELGLPVFERRRRGVSLTAAGAAFLAYAEEALKLVAEGKQRVSDLRHMRHGAVTLLCLPTIATYWLPRVIASFRHSYPEVEIQIHERAGCTPSDVQSGIADFGIVQLPEELEPVEPTMHVERLLIDEQVLVFPSDHRLVESEADQAAEISLKDVASEPFVLPGANCGMTRTISRALSEAGVQPRIRLETSQIEAIYEMVSAGLGVGLMPAMAMHRNYPNVVCRRIKPPAPRRTIVIASSPAKSPSPAAAALMEAARNFARQQQPAPVVAHLGPGRSTKRRRTRFDRVEFARAS